MALSPKIRVSLAALASALLITGALVLAGQLTASEVEAQSYPTFSSLSDADPVVAGGVTSQMVLDWIANGYTVTLETTAVDAPDRIVEFRDPATGELEWRIGTVPAGTQYYVLSNMGFGPTQVARPCGNKLHADTPLDDYL